MIPRFRKLLLGLGLLSLLVIPTTTNATAQEVPPHDGELEGTVTASQVIAPCPGTNVASHQRCEGNFVDAGVDLVARRLRDPDPNNPNGRRHELTCVDPETDTSVPFRTRQTAAEGRGFVGPSAHINPDVGILERDNNDDGDFLDPGEVVQVNCRVRVEDGDFHRVGNVAYGRIRIDVHAELAGVDVFRHHYCGRFEANAVPVPPTDITLVTAVANGRVDCTPDPLDVTHSRIVHETVGDPNTRDPLDHG